VDKTAPVITAGNPTGTKGSGNTWLSDVTVPFSATDNLSGFAPDGSRNIDLPSETTVGEGSGLMVTSEGIYDIAGNFAKGIPAGPFDVFYPKADLGSNLRNLRAYYEILSNFRLVSNEPATPTMYGYHPLVVADMSAFDSITLDANAYDFIQDNIDLKKSISPYLSENTQPEKKKKI
jgi:hypothetical protein